MSSFDGALFYLKSFVRLFCYWKADGFKWDGVLDALVACPVPYFGFDIGLIGREIHG